MINCWTENLEELIYTSGSSIKKLGKWMFSITGEIKLEEYKASLEFKQPARELMEVRRVGPVNSLQYLAGRQLS